MCLEGKGQNGYGRNGYGDMNEARPDTHKLIEMLCGESGTDSFVPTTATARCSRMYDKQTWGLHFLGVRR